MAVKDPLLDRKIMEAATAEFLEHGFQGASLRQIAQRANLTTGALYTRYDGKDALFCAVVEGILAEIGHVFDPVRQSYLDAQRECSAEAILAAIRQEEQAYHQILLQYYDQCVLFFCKSDGSSLQAKLEQMMAYKARETVAYMEGLTDKTVNADAIEMLLSEQFYSYRALLQKHLDAERTVACLHVADAFHEAGWKELLHQIMS